MRYLYRYIIALVLTLSTALAANAQFAKNYSAEHPLVVAGNWDFPPFEFSNDTGHPDGYCVDVLKAVFQRMGVPYKFVMKEWPAAAAMFRNGEADLILNPLIDFLDQPYVTTENVINYSNFVVASRQDRKPISRLLDLEKADSVVLRGTSAIVKNLIKRQSLELNAQNLSVIDALGGLAAGKFNYFVWNEEPLKWKLKQLNLNGIVLTRLDISPSETHVTGRDAALIDAIDGQITQLEQSGDIEIIYDKWFHPEIQHDNTSPVVVYATLAVVALALIFLVMNRLIRRRVKAAAAKNEDLKNMMAKALDMGSYMVTEYDVQSDRFTNHYGTMLPPEGMTMEQFISRIHPDEKATITREMEKLRTGESGIWEMNKRWNAGTPEHPDWQNLHGQVIAEKDHRGQVRYIVNAVKNVTSDVEQERHESEAARKYIQLFESTLVAMSFYDKDGMLIDMNDNMRQLCCFDEESERYFRQTRMFEIPLFKDDFDPTSRDQFHVCQHMVYPEAGINKYAELRIQPTYVGDELQYYIVTARDVSSERDMYQELKEHDRELHQADDVIRRYEDQLRYLLENSEMFVIRANRLEQTISFSRSQQSIYTQTYDDYLKMVVDEDLQETINTLNWQKNEPFHTVRHFKYTTLQPDKHSCFSFSCVPTLDGEGNVIGHFGVARNITRLMDAQEQLRIETRRAEESGKLKSVFLANMAHEIRTPLNAIVGFSDILQLVDTEEEQMEFIRIIRSNCDMLLRLISDILEASSMGQALAIEPTPCDLSQVFDDICQTLAQRVQEPGVEFVKDNPYDTLPATLDKGRLQQVLTNFTTNAVKYTHQGHIKVGYRLENRGVEGLYFYCEDTGAGIPKEEQPKVFERFVKLNTVVQGTGLGLSICKAIAERCGGQIGIFSEGEGHGSTFWLWIPREPKTK